MLPGPNSYISDDELDAMLGCVENRDGTFSPLMLAVPDGAVVFGLRTGLIRATHEAAKILRGMGDDGRLWPFRIDRMIRTDEMELRGECLVEMVEVR